ncbi:MAG: hypothetical protein KIT17_19770 [Rubrivivax sp.]|nr:hypothetical protein [Rubrivivax sp.]
MDTLSLVTTFVARTPVRVWALPAVLVASFAATASLLYGSAAGLLAARAARVLAHERLAVPAAAQAA